MRRVRLTRNAMIVFVTTWLVYLVGARGYGEKSVVHSISYAKALATGNLESNGVAQSGDAGDSQRFDVTQLINVFVTAADRYVIRHAAQSGAYSSSRQEYVLATSTSGPKASLRVDIPVFSSRPLIHRGVMQLPMPAIEVVAWGSQPSWMGGVRIRCDDSVGEAWLFHGDRGMRMRKRDGALVAGTIRSVERTLAATDGRLHSRIQFHGMTYPCFVGGKTLIFQHFTQAVATQKCRRHFGGGARNGDPLAITRLVRTAWSRILGATALP